jgi:GNAT superfamily N-acetyltransferase
VDIVWEVTSLDRNHDVRTFDCGDEDLNRYLRQFAERHAKRGMSRTYVAFPVTDPSRVIGYFTLSAGSVSNDAAVSDESLPKHPIPTLHLGRLGVAREYQRLGALGPGLLGEAYSIALTMAEKVGCYAIDVYAKTERAKRFYVRHGFIQLKDDDLHLWIRLKDIRASLES